MKTHKFDPKNIGNYVLLIRLRTDDYTIGESMPIDIKLRFINRHLVYFTPKTQRLIIAYVNRYLPLVKA